MSRMSFRLRLLQLGMVFLVGLTAAAAAAQDPTASGPFAVSTAIYDRGDTAFECDTSIEACSVCSGQTPGCAQGELALPNFELRAEVYYPTNLSAGPFPLVLFVHGSHATCYEPDFGFPAPGWPCPYPSVPIENYRGYDYAGKLLASHGYIVASVSANGIHGRAYTTADVGRGMPETALMIEEHLGIWNTFNTTGSSADGGPFAADFVGRVDLSNVGTMGHSRGGEGVVHHLATYANGSPFSVRAALPIAPTNFDREVVNDVPLGVLLGYCDGDVIHLEGLKYFDDARYNVPDDQAPKYTFLALGANHNFFNTVWTPECWQNQGGPDACWNDARGLMPGDDATIDEWTEVDSFCSRDQPGNGRLSPAEQRALGGAYLSAFFRYHLGGEAGFGPLLRGEVSPPASIDPRVHVGYHPPASHRIDVNRLSVPSELQRTTLTGDGELQGWVFHPEIDPYEACGASTAEACQVQAQREAHLTSTVPPLTGMQRARVSWTDLVPSPGYVHELPLGAQDVSDMSWVQFRAAVDVEDPRNATAAPVNFSLILSGGGNSVFVDMDAQPGQNDFFFPPGATAHATAVMNTVRFPLSAFAGINLQAVPKVEFQMLDTPGGTVFFSDIMFSNETPEWVTNSGFEGTTADWLVVGGGGVLASSSLQAHSGQSSARVTQRTQAYQGPGFDLRGRAERGFRYRAKAWARVEGDSSEPVLLTRWAACAGQPDAWQTVASATATDSGWVELSGTVEVPNCDLTTLTLYVEGPRPGVTLYADDVSVVGPLAPFAATLQTTYDWGSGYCADLKVTNHSATPTENWSVNIHTNGSTIYTAWNVSSDGSAGSVRLAPDQSWGLVIAPGQSSNAFGFCANRSSSGPARAFVTSAEGEY